MARNKRQFTLVQIDGVPIQSKTPKRRIQYVEQVQTLLQHAGVTLKIEKCFFFMETIDSLEHVIRLRGLQSATHTAEAI